MKIQNHLYSIPKLLIFFLITLILSSSCNNSDSNNAGEAAIVQTSDSSDRQWFEGKAWQQGFQRTPDETINYQHLKTAHDADPEAWKTAFTYLKNTDLAALEPGKYPIDGEKVFALVTKGAPKSQDTAAWESHRRHFDIHCVAAGKEKIAIGPLESVTVKVPYDSTKDIGFFTGTGTFRVADTSNFFIVFPPDAHCPGVAVEGNPEVKKVVIKIKKGS